jgi:hypothetical protein
LEARKTNAKQLGIAMAFTKVTPLQFVFVGDSKVCHRLTGSSFETPRYADPADSCSQLIESRGLADKRLPGGVFDLAEIRAVAIQLLRERARSGA